MSATFRLYSHLMETADSATRCELLATAAMDERLNLREHTRLTEIMMMLTAREVARERLAAV